MAFQDYISTSQNTEKPDPSKIVLDDDAYALLEALHELTEKLAVVGRKL